MKKFILAVAFIIGVTPFFLLAKGPNPNPRNWNTNISFNWTKPNFNGGYISEHLIPAHLWN
jgi:hypothetical protein